MVFIWTELNGGDINPCSLSTCHWSNAFTGSGEGQINRTYMFVSEIFNLNQEALSLQELDFERKMLSLQSSALLKGAKALKC